MGAEPEWIPDHVCLCYCLLGRAHWRLRCRELLPQLCHRRVAGALLWAAPRLHQAVLGPAVGVALRLLLLATAAAAAA